MAGYFTLNFEPSLFAVVMFSVIGLVGILFSKKFMFICMLLCAVFGFGYSGTYSHIKNTMMLSHDLHNAELSGRIHELEHTDDKLRIFIDTEKYGLVRVSTKSDIRLKIGDKITGTGGLFKLAPAYTPETFDFARWGYFNNITATGYINDIKIIENNKHDGLNNIRWDIHKKANSFLTDALVLGYQKTLPQKHREIWTQNGVAHIWSISGYHMTLLAGWLFAVFYMIFRCIPAITRRTSARIPAIICAWFGLIGYLALSGCGVATLRAFLMTTLVMIAFVLGRNVLSLRTACIVFVCILLLNPYYVMTAGFQLSFSAIFGLVWLWTIKKPILPSNKILKYLYAAILTALTATLFTMPFALAHFNSIPLYGLIGNLIFLPLFSFVIMPLVIFGTIFSLLGTTSLLNLAHSIYDKIFGIATDITTMPWANISTGNISNVVLILFVLGLASLIFIVTDEKFKSAILRHLNIVLAIVFCFSGIVLVCLSPRPIVYISNDHNLIGHVQNGKLLFSKTKDSGNYFAFETWKKSNREDPDSQNKKLPKNKGIIIINNGNWKLAYAQRFMPLSKNIEAWCKNSDIKYIVSYFDIKSKTCDKKIISGGAVIYDSGRIQHITTNRLWHNRH
ncbi:MAG: ComEC family competence protein [Alphaproteobacteria bacterium]|nr:ComEC family competence protein [Alphaproteobacteria bacterium]